MVKGHCLVEEEHLWHRISCSIKHIRWNITCNLDTKDMCTRKIDLSEVSQCPPNNNTQKAVALIGTAMLGLLTAWSDFIWVFLCLHSNLYHPNHPLLKVWWRVAHLFHIQETIATDVIPLPSVQKSMASVTLKDNRWDGWFGSSTRNGKLQTHLPKTSSSTRSIDLHISHYRFTFVCILFLPPLASWHVSCMLAPHFIQDPQIH